MGVLRKAFKDVMHQTNYKILRGDKVMVTAGKDAGQVGTVLKVIRDTKFPRVVVEGLNLNKRHIKRSKDSPGGIVSVESPVHYSNVSLVDPVTGRPARVTWRFLQDGTRVRVTRGRGASASVVPRPEVLTQRAKPRTASAGQLDTPVAAAEQRTHSPGDLPSFLKQRLAAAAPPQAAAPLGQQARQYHSGRSGGSSSSLAGVGGARSRWQLLGSSSMLGGLWRSFASLTC